MARDPVHARAVGLLLCTALCWSLGGILIKWIAWPPLAIAGARGFLAALFLVVVQRRLRFTLSSVQLGAAVAYALCTFAFVVATKLTTAANAILLQYTAPVWVALAGAWFLGERTTRLDWVAIVIAFIGMGLFFADGLRADSLLGIGVGLLAGLGYAAMTLLMRKQKDSSVTESIILGNLIAGAIGLPFMIAAPALPTSGWLPIMALGFVQLGLGYAIYSRAIKHVTALEAVIIPVIEPILNPLWVMLFIGEKPGGLALLGGLLVLLAVTWRAVHSIRQPARQAVRTG